MSIDTRKNEIQEVLRDNNYFDRPDHEKLIALLRHILPIGQKFKVWQADEDPAEALEIIQDQLKAAVDEDRKALLKAEKHELLARIRRRLEEYQRAVA